MQRTVTGLKAAAAAFTMMGAAEAAGLDDRPTFEGTGVLEDVRAIVRQSAAGYGAAAIAAVEDARREEVKRVLAEIDAYQTLASKPGRPDPAEINLLLEPDAGFVAFGDAVVRPRVGWRRSALDDMDDDACAGWLNFASFCHDQPTVANRRLLLVVDDKFGSTIWETYAGVALGFKSGVMVDVAYKEFRPVWRQAHYIPRGMLSGLDDEGVMLSLTVPCGR
ncbi:MAG: hypothetical protein AAFR11_04845 [Pseudomonadota bacterium]